MSMPDDDFRLTIARLWSRLGMQPPRFIEEARIQLRVESVSLDLLDNGRGTLVIEGAAGHLAADPADRARQIRTVLQSNLGLLLNCEAGVYLAPLPSGKTALMAHASYPFAMAKLDRLMKKIEDTVTTIEYYAGELKSAAVPGVRHASPTSSNTESAVIFRP